MRNAETILSIIRDRGSRGLPLEDVYRQLFNPELYLLAYGKVSVNKGALTPGATSETADGMDLDKIQTIIGLLRNERYRWTPARRVYIEKKNSTKKRPLGVPTWSDKLLQEVIRLILEAYYEPQFSTRSHGFRPGRGCHTALAEIHNVWQGTAWFIEGDIAQCFDSLDHNVLLTILREKIHDGRFIRLIENLLKAGYLEDWRFHNTPSGSPQGGVVSPILSNIYLDRLDQYVEHDLVPEYTRGTKRNPNPAYRLLVGKRGRALKGGRKEEARRLLRQMWATPSQDTRDTGYRRLRYVRYADDFLLGFAGPRAEAEEIKRKLGTFLGEKLNLELSETKTLVTHGRTGAANFLGYELVVLHADHRITKTRRGAKRCISGGIGLKVPANVVREKCKPYMRDGKPIHRTERTTSDDYSIVREFDSEYRGIVEHYRLAFNLHTFHRLRWVMETSLTKTLAVKHKISVSKVYRRYRTTVQTERGERPILQATKTRKEEKPLVATWGTTTLARNTDATLNDRPKRAWNKRTEIVDRLLADTCELCGSREHVQVHHIRALKDLDRYGRTKPDWVREMAARQRKKLVVCRGCHYKIHAGRLQR